jgi:hypothetical protein
MDNVPVIWGYFFDEVIGSAVIEDDGTVTMRLVDPRIKILVEQGKKDFVKGISLSNKPGIPVQE